MQSSGLIASVLMRPIGVALACAIVVGLAGARAARACSCLPPAPPADAASRAAAVFEGRTFGARREQNELRFAFEVARVWKGDVPPSIEIVTPVHSAACGRAYEFGVPYIIYASVRDDGTLADNLCSRSRMVVDAVEDLDTLGSGRAPLEGGPQAPGPVGPDVEPPRIEASGPEPTPTSPGKRGCAVGTAGFGASSGIALLAFVLTVRRRSRLWQTKGA
jgi:hypothetical protein